MEWKFRGWGIATSLVVGEGYPGELHWRQTSDEKSQSCEAPQEALGAEGAEGMCEA